MLDLFLVAIELLFRQLVVFGKFLGVGYEM